MNEKKTAGNPALMSALYKLQKPTPIKDEIYDGESQTHTHRELSSTRTKNNVESGTLHRPRGVQQHLGELGLLPHN
jgi:hypothetical protein